MGCGSSVAQEPTTKTLQEVPKNSPKPTSMRGDKFLSREEARERRQHAIKEKQLQSQNNARVISAQALVDQERLSTSTKRSLRSYASSSTTTPLKSSEYSKILGVQNPVSGTTNERNLTTSSEEAVVSSSSSQQTAKDDRLPQVVIAEEKPISSDKTEGTVSQQLELIEGDNKTLEYSEHEVGSKSEVANDREDDKMLLLEKLGEDSSTADDENNKTLTEKVVSINDHELNEELPKKIETEDILTNEGHEMNRDGYDEALKTSNSKEKDSVRFSDTVTIVESSVPQVQRSSDENGALSVETVSSEAAMTERETTHDDDEGTMDHHVITDAEVVKTSSRVGEGEFNDASEVLDEGVADLGEIGEENEVVVSPVAS